ncbi:MAG: L-histidine N(alpha)-methyltransferase [Terriglobia bacterium]
MTHTPPSELATDPLAAFADDIRAGLSEQEQKRLSPQYFYDEIGSALFDVITLLPEYGLTRADERLLERSAAALAAGTSRPLLVAELGSGSGRKTHRLLGALAAERPVTYCPIEVSHAALARCEKELEGVEGVRLQTVEAEYLEGLRRVTRIRRSSEPVTVLFLGSSVGNFDPAGALDLLRSIREVLLRGDTLLLSTDLVKPAEQLRLAYDDPAGVTAAFNLNLLARINRELAANFELSRFRHFSFYNQWARRVEMHLRSTARQTVTIRQAELTVEFERGETIWTESSYKYEAEDVRKMGEQAGFRCEAQWIDEEWPFAQTLLATG